MHRTSYGFAAFAAMLILSATAAHANRAAADACAAKLSPEAKLVYAATIGSVKAGGDLVATITEKTRGLVMSGKLNRSNARPAAEAAGTCLKHAAQ